MTALKKVVLCFTLPLATLITFMYFFCMKKECNEHYSLLLICKVRNGGV
jgi:hypothetical protein